MIAKQLISDLIVPLKSSDTAATALSLMDDYRVSHMPIVNNVEFLGLVSEKDIYEMNDFDSPLGAHALSLNRPYVYEYQHAYDVLRLVSDHQLSLVPVLDEHHKYLGCITIAVLIEHFAHIVSVNNPGGIIVLEMSYNDYSATEISQIVETNDAKILSLFITSHTDSTKIEVTLKINKIEIGPILQTFNRYNYLIKASYSEEYDTDDLKERYDSLMKYLNI